MLFGQNAKIWKNYAGMIFGKAGSRVTVPDSFLVSNRLTCCGAEVPTLALRLHRRNIKTPPTAYIRLGAQTFS